MISFPSLLPLTPLPLNPPHTGADLLPKPDEPWSCVSCLAIANNLAPTPGIVTPAPVGPEAVADAPTNPDEPAPQLACVLCPRRGTSIS